MIRPDTRNTKDYTKAEWFALPRDYRFFIEVDFSDVVEHEARRRLVESLQPLGPNEIKVYAGVNSDEAPTYSVEAIVVE